MFFFHRKTWFVKWFKTCVILDFENIGMDSGCQIRLPFVWSSYTLPDLVCPPQWVPVPKVFCPSAGSRRPWSGEGCSRWAQSRQHCSWKNKFKEKLIKNKKEHFFFGLTENLFLNILVCHLTIPRYKQLVMSY